MAITKVFAIRSRLDTRIDYAANEEKTALEDRIGYALNPQKTEKRLYESVVNLTDVGSAFRQMRETKRRFMKEDGILGYHFIQSFAPDEVTAEKAHAIGVAFCERLFGDRFEAVIGTHLDKHHLHNHIIVNSVSFVDGKKYHSSPASYYNSIRLTSDELCRENDLSVIAPSGRGMHYAEWKAQKDGRPTVRGQMRQELDEIIRVSYTVKDFWRILNERGYVIHRKGENILHTSIIPPFAARPVRLDSLGNGYTEEDIAVRIAAARNGIRQNPPSATSKTYRANGSIIKAKPKKLHGFMALYYHYLYLFGMIKRKKTPQRVSFFMREELIKLERYRKQFRFLHEHGITTGDDLEAYRKRTSEQIVALTDERQSLYAAGGKRDDERIVQIGDMLRKCRADDRMCGAIMKDCARIADRTRGAKALMRMAELERMPVEARRR